MKQLHALVTRWLAEGETLERYHDSRGAEVCKLHAAELSDALTEFGRESLTLTEAAQESGYSADHLRHLVADGTIPNAGRKGSPRIARSDLPTKPGASPPDSFDPDREAREILQFVHNKRGAA